MSLTLLTKASWIGAKAVVAQLLIAHAWEQTLTSGQNTKPWQWADTWPVAALTPPNGDKLYVLASTSGQALAFGPGLLSASAAPGTEGNTVIAGHRDTHFKFMEYLLIGDILNIENKTGNTHSYRVDHIEIVDSSRQQILLQQQTAELTLITCYPFNALTAGGPLRYVIHAKLL